MRKPIINPANPRLSVSVDWGSVWPAPVGAELYVRRVGDPADFAVYTAIEETGGQITFQFDDLLFVRAQGRYAGRLLVGDRELAYIEFEYRDSVRVTNVGNPDHV